MGREPQQDRSRATRESLLDATIESLAEVGWHGTTVVAVAARAGVSRGAAQHHFASRDDLVRDAVQRVADGLGDRLRTQPADEHDDNPVLDVLTRLTSVWTDVVGRAALNLWVAAASDPTLRALVVPIERRFSREMEELTIELLHADPSRQEVQSSVRLTLDVARGIGLGAVVRQDLQQRKADLAQWAAILGTMPGIGGGVGL
ncbi:TetR/AcrR family transcriptional regulator [Nocardioides sp. WS12]|uniref:TetR/AcrR family transcriptional regulator n=1 Tax=Nocardioides sp. WS12 TaxID=2486272 RepID=UPI0015FD1BD0|nr:TetR/AcrR family transcriptional regulator [Nocardioides sp. WS12]